MSGRTLPFKAGDRVRIVDLGKAGHVRTPFYARGKVGVVERCGGTFQNPEERAYGRGRGTEVRLYRVRLRQSDLWPDYAGGPNDSLDIEIYEHWLKPEEEGDDGARA